MKSYKLAAHIKTRVRLHQSSAKHVGPELNVFIYYVITLSNKKDDKMRKGIRTFGLEGSILALYVCSNDRDTFLAGWGPDGPLRFGVLRMNFKSNRWKEIEKENLLENYAHKF